MSLSGRQRGESIAKKQRNVHNSHAATKANNGGIKMERTVKVWFPLVFTGWLLLAVEVYFSPWHGVNEKAQLGDASGIINSLVSAFAFASVAVSLYVQFGSLNKQAEELYNQREDLWQSALNDALAIRARLLS